PERKPTIGRFLIMDCTCVLSWQSIMATEPSRGAARPTSFSKSLFFGLLPEEMTFPYPRPSSAERENLRLILDSLHKLKIDSARIDQEARIPPELLAELKQMGLFGLGIPEAYGGAGLSTTGYARVFQEIAGIDPSVAVTLGAHQSIGCKGIVLFGTEAQKRK